jgi:hypothetical protein
MVPADCPLTFSQLVDTTIDEFNQLLEVGEFSDEQKANFRHLRKAGKNRVSAILCVNL